MPQFLFEPWKPEAPAQQVHAALADRQEREFLIGFYLKNPLTHAWEADLQLLEPQETVVEDGADQAIRMSFYGSQTGKLSEIICETRDRAPRCALERCFGTTSRLLSLWSISLGRGLGIAGFRIADLAHGACCRFARAL